MTKEELRELLEDELLWRSEEINFFKRQLINLHDENEKKRYRKSMVLILYSHLEGFIKSALINYAQYLNGLGKKREEFDFALIATSMNKEFKAYENRRNTIAHGSRTDGVTESEYKKWEDSVKDVMENIVKKIYFYTNNEKYLRIEDE